MRIVPNAGTDRVIDSLTPWLQTGAMIDVITPELSLFAFAELRDELQHLTSSRVILPDEGTDLRLTGSAEDRGARNQLTTRWLAGQLAEWIEKRVQVLAARSAVAQGAVIARDADGDPRHAILGATPFTTDGLGVAPGNPLSLIQATVDPAESLAVARWFDAQWAGISGAGGDRARLLAELGEMATHRAPSLIYALVLHHLFASRGEDLDEERIVRSATGIRDTVVWKKLFRFQRDGVVGALDKLDRYSGCIIADSVGLGKTFEALAIIKYHELRNDRVLVLCPSGSVTTGRSTRRTTGATSSRPTASTTTSSTTRTCRVTRQVRRDQPRDVNWGNYDLVVIDEIHNFRNKLTPEGGRRDPLRPTDAARSSRGVQDTGADALGDAGEQPDGRPPEPACVHHRRRRRRVHDHGIPSIEPPHDAQRQFNRWLDLDEPDDRRPALRRCLASTTSRCSTCSPSPAPGSTSRSTTGPRRRAVPDRLKPINIRADIDRRVIPAVRDEPRIRRLNLSAYAPLRYVLPKAGRVRREVQHGGQGGNGFFRQADREESLIHLMRVNCSSGWRARSARSRLPSSSSSGTSSDLMRIESEEEDRRRDRHRGRRPRRPGLREPAGRAQGQGAASGRGSHPLETGPDRGPNRLATLLRAARQVDANATPSSRPCASDRATRPEPDQPGNRKVIVFTAFADTAPLPLRAARAVGEETLGLEAPWSPALGATRLRSRARKDLGSILTAFSPLSKERPEDLADDGELDLLIATDCISEGQNLQDCDWLVNYDIHWNPVRIIQRFGRIDRIGSPNDASSS